MSDNSISGSESKAALEKILSSQAFQGKDLTARFLEFVVLESLAGRSDRIKGTAIAIEVYHRSADFDPQSDPIVRVEARKLRRNIEYYYLTEGADDEIRIDIPKGGYVPTITRFEPAQKAPTTLEDAETPDDFDTSDARALPPQASANLTWRLGWRGLALLAAVILIVAFGVGRSLMPSDSGEVTSVSGPTLFVLPFEAASDSANEFSLARAVTIETSNALTKFTHLKVYPVGPSYPFEKISSEIESLAFTLSGDVQVVGDKLLITAQLQQATDGLLVWSEKYAGQLLPDQIFEIQAEIAESVAKELAEPFGLLGDLSRREIETNHHPSLSSYECVLLAYEYRSTFAREKHGPARDCLEKAVLSDPEYSRAWALLAYIYADEYRFFYNERPESYRRALEAGQKAVDLNADDALSYQALSIALFGNGEIEASLVAGRQAVDLNPHNTEALIQMGYRTFSTGRWDEGKALVEEAIAESLSPPQWYPWVLALYYYKYQDFERARELAEAAGLPGFVLFEATRTAIYGQLGLTDEATASLNAVRRLDPEFDRRARRWFGVHHFPEDFLDSIMAGLEKAGLGQVAPR